MKRVYGSVEQWLDPAVRGIRFKPDRMKVAGELREHIEDKMLDLQRIFPDMTREEVRQRALDQMGDPEAIGEELARIHKPWWGRIWAVTRWVARICLAYLLLVAWLELPLPFREGSLRDWYEHNFGQSEWDYVEECYLTGRDPYDETSPWYDPEREQTDVVRTPLYVSDGDHTARAGRYSFKVDRYALWSFTGGETPEEEWWLFAELKVTGPPGEPFAHTAATRISAKDSLGNYYYSSYETYDLGIKENDEPYVMVNQGDTGLFTRTFQVECPAFPSGAEWLRLDFDRGNGSWSITIPLKEVDA